ncbi:MAG: hypothetical protein K0M45_07385 [Candidatus Paracaedibacteraceae bacterium]|nr:hypothetical protein [Candidatus Paracaedibacteraceae bacterium]
MQRHLLSVTSCLGIVGSLVHPSMANSITALETNQNIITAINSISPISTIDSTAVAISDIEAPGPNDMDGASLGTFTATASTSSFWGFDNSSNPGNIYAQSYTGGAWRTFSATLPASWNSTTNITLQETVRDGVSSPASPYSLVLTLTKATTGTPADLTNTVLASYLTKAATNSFTTSGGTALVGTGLTIGWTAKALLQDGSSSPIIAATSNPVLDPIGITIGVNITPSGGTAINYSATLLNLHTWNVATGAATLKNVLFTGAGSRSIKFQPQPGNFVRTAGISAGLITVLNNSPRLLSQTSKTYLNNLLSAVEDVLDLMGATPPANVKTGVNIVANSKIASASFDDTAYSTTLSLTPVSVGTGGRIGLIALASDDIIVSSWTVDEEVLTATGTIGSAAAKAFTCDLSTLTTATINTTSSVLQFSAADGTSFWLKCLAADTGATSPLDASTNTAVASTERNTLLAMQLHNILSSTTTIPHLTLDVLAGA